MPLDFPPAPSVNDTYPPPPAQPRWIFNGTSWVSAPAVTGLYLPIAGGTMAGPGNLTVDGITTLNGTVTVDNNLTVTGDFDVSGTTLLDGVTADAITLTAAPTSNMEVTNKQYVDEEVAAGGLWKGTWDAENNVPDLTASALQVNAWGWTVTTSDHTTPFEIPATPVIPGLNGVIVYDGDHVIWSTAASAYEVVHGSSLSLQEAQDMFPAKLDAIIRGVPGTYTQGTDFTNFQTFLDANINNRWFDGNVTINLNTPNTTQVTMRNVRGAWTITINTSVQIAAAFICQDMGVNTVFRGTGPTTTTSMWLRGGSVQLFGGQPGGVGPTSYGSVTAAWEAGGTYLTIGEAASNIAITTLTVNTPSSVYLAQGTATVSITTITNQGLVVIPSNSVNLTVNSWGTGAGVYCDQRLGDITTTYRDTFTRRTEVYGAPPKTIPNGTDFDDLLIAGSYKITSGANCATMLNFPLVSGISNCRVDVELAGGATHIHQHVHFTAATLPQVARGASWSRYKNGLNDWTPWMRGDIVSYLAQEAIKTGMIWLDGRPVYQNTFVFDANPPTGSWSSLPAGSLTPAMTVLSCHYTVGGQCGGDLKVDSNINSFMPVGNAPGVLVTWYITVTYVTW